VSDLGFKQRLLLFMYGAPNLAGSTLGVIGLTCYFAGIIDHLWPLIVAGLYGIGYLAAPRSPDAALVSHLSNVSLRDAIAQLMRDLDGKLPAEANRLMQSILSSVESILPKLEELQKSGSIVSDETFTVRETITRYLPETLEAYLRLTLAYANLHNLKAGKSPKQMLLDQLKLLDERLSIMAANVLAEDLQALESNGRFLQEKFGSETLVPMDRTREAG
jgi:hypothetical protein